MDETESAIDMGNVGLYASDRKLIHIVIQQHSQNSIRGLTQYPQFPRQHASGDFDYGRFIGMFLRIKEQYARLLCRN
jgi:hypothetical protein